MRAFLTFIIAISLQSLFYCQTNGDFFSFDVLNFYSEEGTNSRVDIYIDLPLSNLEFKRSPKEKSLYISKLDISIDVFDEAGKNIYSNVSKEEIATKNIKGEYLSQNSQILTKNLFLTPGKYNLNISIFESSTKKKQERSKKLTVEDFKSPALSISSVMIVSRLIRDGQKKTITPDPSRNVGESDTFYIFCYIYNNTKADMINADFTINGPDGKEVFFQKQSIESYGEFQNQLLLEVPSRNFTYGKFTIDIKAYSDNYSVSSRSEFVNFNPDIPLSNTNIDELIDQLQYAATDDEIKFIRKGKDENEKVQRFLEFWKKKDPSPNTRKNEAMSDYYRRISIADKLFSTKYTKGWRTDMGMVYVIFGEPSNVSRYPYEMDSKPYEVWDYYNLNRSFVFVDDSGFGDYRLVTPIWEIYRFNY